MLRVTNPRSAMRSICREPAYERRVLSACKMRVRAVFIIKTDVDPADDTARHYADAAFRHYCRDITVRWRHH